MTNDDGLSELYAGEDAALAAATETRTVASWRSRGGASHFLLYCDRFGYGYESSGGGGYLGPHATDDDAIALVVASGRVANSQPDANVTAMRRTA